MNIVGTNVDIAFGPPPCAPGGPATAVRPPSLLFMPGLIHFDLTARAFASEDARRVLQSLLLDPGALYVETP